MLARLPLPVAEPVTAGCIAPQQRVIFDLRQGGVACLLGVLAAFSLPASYPVTARRIALEQKLARVGVVVDLFQFLD